MAQVKKTKKKSTTKKQIGSKITKNIQNDKAKKAITKRNETASKNIRTKSNKEIKSIKNKILITLMFLGIAVLGIILFSAIYIIATAPKFNTSLLYNKEATVFYDKDGNEYGRIGVEKRELVEYSELPQVLIDAIIATEDSRYFQHNGFDVARFMKAGVGQLSGNTSSGGASTLTMQVVKNTFTSSEASGIKGIIRKFTDIYMSIFKVERNYTKEEIIEFYVNYPWLAENNSWGVMQACQTLFGKSVSDLNLAEASLLAGLFQNPYYYNPYVNPELAEGRRNTVLTLMERHGYISEEQKNDAGSISVVSMLNTNRSTSSSNEYQPFIDTVVQEVLKKTGNDPYSVPMKIYTTMDSSVQKTVNDVQNGVYYSFDKYKFEDKVQLAIAITDTKDGSITAIGNGRNVVGERQFNRATQMYRHPGSTAKPFFAYGPYIEYNNGSTYSLFLDEQWKYSNGSSLKNAEGAYRGLMTMRTALASSRNIPAVQAFQEVSDANISEFVHNIGINYGNQLYESASIGGFDGMSPIQLSAAFGAFARGGYYIEPYSYTKIEYLENDEVLEYKPTKERAMSPETAYMINSILTTAGAQGAGGNFTISGTEIAAKTGTSTVDANVIKSLGIPSSVSMDNWNCVYTTDYSISLWYGMDRLASDAYTTSLNAAIARKTIMVPLAKNVLKKNAKFSVPSGIVRSKVEYETFPAQLPSEHTPSNLIVTEIFKKGTEPSAVSTRFSNLSTPTDGSYTTNGSSITISWTPIATPDAVNADYLTSHFNNYYGDYAQKYYNQRMSYNSSTLGNFGYQVYLKDATGKLTALGFTSASSYTYNGAIGVDYTFVIKSTYSIFKNNMSAGLEITTSSTSTPPVENTNSISGVVLNGDSTFCSKKSSTAQNYTDKWATNPVTVFDINSNDISAQSNISSRYYKDDTPITNIDLNVIGNYKQIYTVTYNGSSDNSTRNIIICENGCTENNTCI